MAKYVEFDGSVIGIENKNFKIIDSSKNVKKAAQHYQSLIKRFDTEDEDSIKQLVGNSPMLTEEIANTIADIADLSAKEKAGLQDQSFSDQYNIFNDFLIKFLGIQMPSLDDDSDEDEDDSEVETDPKSPDEN
ncbi:hypothetical protein [Loigolactobacillus backii]|uniref:Uncharacterized protein n=1 Tax=Loigolactobacillus backii TaxID=375175 RepID=A0A192H4Q4_9LACO|nr:hypothetical protein [Loigolactobacillus backii]ANK63360.1 hypothetical protein AYR53_11615 [Loigolactobacillus backii]ANK66595.1 hypothetical protein AYR55_02125 [Loigolactobacillus backii]ANK69635.1 hypothetical protein AYR56_05390 [Loigolactobacillus backii]MDA5386527.1 hypothetical protein [Loigolactobacillus backii]MDA5389054.1 hypothetical protein [Loigolactobacillus backii]